MPNTPAKRLSFDDFQASQPQPTIPSKHSEGQVWLCDGCGSEFSTESAWCVNCIKAWEEAHTQWLVLHNSEFEAWFAKHKADLLTHLPSTGHVPNPEFVPERIREDRKKHFKDTIQPFRDGEPSGEYIRQYPEQAKKMFSASERKKAKDVWRDITPSHLKNTI